MDLIKITDLTNQLHISSRSLRYYEQVGLIHSVRPAFEKYRYYDADNQERLKQIMVLRKMQISIKDIIRIYENSDMSTLVEVFVEHIHSLDAQTESLAELRRIVSEFLQTMMQKGIKKISALPLLYEEIDKRLKKVEEDQPVSLKELSAVSDQLLKPLPSAIISLPAMRVLSSYKKEQPTESDIDGFWRWMQQRDPAFYQPGNHQWFEFETDVGDVMMAEIPDDLKNDSQYRDYIFEGGLFASIHVYVDEDLGAQLQRLIADFDRNPFYEIAYDRHGGLRHPVLLENLISPDEKRQLVAMLVPVKKRLPNPALFDSPEECTGLTLEQLDAANPVLWEKEAALNGLTPVKKAGGIIRYEMLPGGEALFATYVGTRYLSTNIQVKLPFRVDMKFKVGRAPENADEAVRIHFGNCVLAVNDENNPDPALSKHSIRFTQPLFDSDYFSYPHRGVLKQGEYNTVTWIVGETYFAVIVNGTVRLCLKNLPYMKTDHALQPQTPIMINGGGDIEIIVSKIKISQLEAKMKKRRNGELSMVTKQSNNLIEGISTFCVGERGENFCFDGACEQLMKCVGETDYDYWLIAGITGDCFAQVYPKNHIFYSDRYCVSDYHILYDDDCTEYIEGVFEKLGYACTYVPKDKIRANREMYRQTLMAYIDKGIPVIQFKGNYSLICGYEEHGKVLLQRYPCNDNLDRFSLDDSYFEDREMKGWIFIGEKKEQKVLADMYRKAVNQMAEIMTTDTERYTFGADAFRNWAADIENGFYDGMTGEVDLWETHTSFVCDFETIASKAWVFLSKALELNPDMDFIPKIIEILRRQGKYANNGLEDLGGGFNVTLAALQNTDTRKAIADRIRLFARNMDEIVQLLKG